MPAVLPSLHCMPAARPTRRACLGAALALALPARAAATPPLVRAARQQIGVTTSYDAAYRRMAYPGGDVPQHTGVCTDVVIRAWRQLGVDLQKLVHEDMRRAFAAYPRLWGLKRPDTNIDHRRVPNLQTFFTRQRASLPATPQAERYQAGDMVTWLLGGKLPHIGIVSDRRVGGVPLIIHNMGRGTAEEDLLLHHPITGHYRWRAA